MSLCYFDFKRNVNCHRWKSEENTSFGKAEETLELPENESNQIINSLNAHRYGKYRRNSGGASSGPGEFT